MNWCKLFRVTQTKTDTLAEVNYSTTDAILYLFVPPPGGSHTLIHTHKYNTTHTHTRTRTRTRTHTHTYDEVCGMFQRLMFWDKLYNFILSEKC